MSEQVKDPTEGAWNVVPWVVDVREKRIPVPPLSEVGAWAKAWTCTFNEQFYEFLNDSNVSEESFSQIVQALINSVHDDVMLKVEKAFVMENRKSEVKGDV